MGVGNIQDYVISSPTGGETYHVGDTIPITITANPPIDINNNRIGIFIDHELTIGTPSLYWRVIDTSEIFTEGQTKNYEYTCVVGDLTHEDFYVTIAKFGDSSDEVSTAKFSIKGLTISGSVFPNTTENPSGVSFSITDVGETFYTDKYGYYTASVDSGSYTGTMTPSKTNHTFSPTELAFTAATGSTGSINFIMTYVEPPPTYYYVSGTIYESGTTNPMPYVTMSSTVGFTDPIPVIFYTNENGKYSASFQESSSVVTITPSTDNYTFEPTSKQYYNFSGSQDNQIFSASLVTYMISGSILSSSGDPIAGLTISTSDGPNIYTDNNGQYSSSFTGSTSTTITPASGVWAFIPANLMYYNLSESQFNQDYIAEIVLPQTPGLSNYYDVKKNYDYNTKIWYDISSNGQPRNITTYNTTYNTASKELEFGLYSNSSASFYGIQVSSSFALEFWISPFTSSTAKTLMTTAKNSYPHIMVYITGSQFAVNYKRNLATDTVTVKSYNINEYKYNHVLLFVSESYLHAWSNGVCYESSSIIPLTWNGGNIGINTEYDNNPYRGIVNVFKIWNTTDINLSDINSFYSKRNYWSSLGMSSVTSSAEPTRSEPSASVPTGSDTSTLSFIAFESDDGDVYTCEVTNITGSIITSGALVTII